MNKLRNIFFFLLLTCLPAVLFGQTKEDKKEKIATLRVAFITEKLDLTSKEAQVFWPVFNEYQDKLDALRVARRKDLKDGKISIDALTDKEAEQFVDAEIAYKQKEVDLQKLYHTRFKTILPIKKVAKLYRAEEEFKKELLKQIKEKN